MTLAMLVALGMVHLLGPRSQEPVTRPNEVTLSFDDVKSLPNDELVPRGFNVHFTGSVQSLDTRRFLVKFEGKTIADGEFSRRWDLNWDTSNVSQKSGEITVFWSRPGQALQLMHRFQVDLLQGCPVSVKADFDIATGGLRIGVTGMLPTPDSYYDLQLDNSVLAVAQHQLKDTLVPRSQVVPGMHRVTCTVTLPHKLQLKAEDQKVSTPVLAWLVPDHESSQWDVSSPTVGQCPSGTIKMLDGFSARVEGVEAGGRQVSWTQEGNDLKWRLPTSMLREGSTAVAGSLIDGAGERFATPPVMISIKYTPGYAETLDGTDLVHRIDLEMLRTWEMFKLAAGWKPSGQNEVLFVLRNGALELGGERQEGDAPVYSGYWGLAAKSAKFSFDHWYFQASPSLMAETKDRLERISALAKNAIRSVAKSCEAESGKDYLLPGSEPHLALEWSHDRATNIANSNELLDEAYASFSEAVHTRNGYARSLGIASVSEDRDAKSVLKRLWAKREPPRIAYLEWCEDLFADSQIGPAEDYPLLNTGGLSRLASDVDPEPLEEVSRKLSKAFLIQEWERRGFNASTGLSNIQGEDLNNSRRELSTMFHQLSLASECLLELNGKKTQTRSRDQLLEDLGVDLAAATRALDLSRSKADQVASKIMEE